MKLDIHGDALKLLDDFIYLAKLDFRSLACAMWYDEMGFLKRMRHLEMLYFDALTNDMFTE